MICVLGSDLSIQLTAVNAASLALLNSMNENQISWMGGTVLMRRCKAALLGKACMCRRAAASILEVISIIKYNNLYTIILDYNTLKGSL